MADVLSVIRCSQCNRKQPIAEKCVKCKQFCYIHCASPHSCFNMKPITCINCSTTKSATKCSNYQKPTKGTRGKKQQISNRPKDLGNNSSVKNFGSKVCRNCKKQQPIYIQCTLCNRNGHYRCSPPTTCYLDDLKSVLVCNRCWEIRYKMVNVNESQLKKIEVIDDKENDDPFEFNLTHAFLEVMTQIQRDKSGTLKEETKNISNQDLTPTSENTKESETFTSTDKRATTLPNSQKIQESLESPQQVATLFPEISQFGPSMTVSSKSKKNVSTTKSQEMMSDAASACPDSSLVQSSPTRSESPIGYGLEEHKKISEEFIHGLLVSKYRFTKGELKTMIELVLQQYQRVRKSRDQK